MIGDFPVVSKMHIAQHIIWSKKLEEYDESPNDMYFDNQIFLLDVYFFTKDTTWGGGLFIGYLNDVHESLWK